MGRRSVNESIGHVEAIQDQPRPINHLKRNFSSSNDSNDSEGIDDTHCPNDDENSDFEPRERKKFRRRTEGILDPAFIDRRYDCCQICKAMTGTLQGIRALLSENGYKHLKWAEIQQTGGMGGDLCSVIWEIIEHEDWYHDDDGLTTDEEIRIYAEADRMPYAKENGLSGHPLQNIQLLSLQVKAPLDGGSSEGEILHLVTFEG